MVRCTCVSVHEMSSQGSVILMLVFVLMIEAPRRGLFLGEKRTFVPKQEALLIVKNIMDMCFHGQLYTLSGIIPWKDTLDICLDFFMSGLSCYRAV